MNSKDYWKRRQLEREQKFNDLIEKDLDRIIKFYYEQSLLKIQKDIAALYAQYAVENKLSMSEAKRLIRGKEFSQWRMTLQEYVKAAKNDSDILKELNTLAMRSRISRFEALHARTMMEVADLCEKLEKWENAFQYRAYTEHLYGNLYDIHKTEGLNTPPVAVDKKHVEEILTTPWSGKNYSQRIWKNGRKLERAIQSTMVQAIHRGSSIQKLSKDLSERMNVAYHNAERLVRTELNYIENRAALDAIQEAEMPFYQFVATLDNRTTPMCQSLDGRIFPIEEKNQGENAPPIHVRCRSTVIGTLDDGKSGRIIRGKRAATDENGKRIKIPADMNYNDWKKVYIDKDITLAQWQMSRTLTTPITSTKNCKSFAELQTFWAENYNVKVADKIGTLHIESVQKAMHGVETVIKEFPNAGRFLTEFDIKDSGVMCATYIGNINFNAKYFNDVKNLQCMIQGNTTGFHPKNTGIVETGSHEMGHILERALIDKNGGNVSDWNNCTYAKKIVQEACKSAKKTAAGKGKLVAQLEEEISEYATRNKSECLAEAVADFIANGKNASVLSREIWKILKRELS